MSMVVLSVRFDSGDLGVLKEFVRIHGIRNEGKRFLSPCQIVHSIVKSFVECEARPFVDGVMKRGDVECGCQIGND